MGAQFARRGDEEGVIESVSSDSGIDSCGLLTILDNVLTVGKLAESEEGWRHHSNPGNLLKGAGGVCEKFLDGKLRKDTSAARSV